MHQRNNPLITQPKQTNRWPEDQTSTNCNENTHVPSQHIARHIDKGSTRGDTTENPTKATKERKLARSTSNSLTIILEFSQEHM